ncbi:YraN family protein [Arenimonas sp.]|nr:YraN family protein [Candidatus Parcubacteria bacterium]
MNNLNNKDKKSIGFKGEVAVLDKLKTNGFELFKKNVKSIDAEIDIVVYKYNTVKYTLDIRVIEVKTRNRYEFDLNNFNITHKWRRIRKHLFNIKAEIDSKFDILNYSEIHFDLALVRYKNDKFDLYSYIKDVNLML